MKQETICWKCARAYGKCPWSDGSFTPVDGWTATPTKLKYKNTITDSYLVEKCPLFVSDVWSQIRTKELAKILNVDPRTVSRWSDKYTIVKARICGYELRIYRENTYKKMCIRKIRKVE